MLITHFSEVPQDYPAIRSAIEKLSDQEYTTLAYVYGLNRWDTYLPCKDIAKGLGVSNSRITILKASSLTKFSGNDIKRELETMVDSAVEEFEQDKL